MTWGVENNVVERFAAAGVSAGDVTFSRDTFTFEAPYAPSQFLNTFRRYYGPTMNAYEAAEKDGRADELHHELETLFNAHNKSGSSTAMSIPATFLRVTVAV